MNNNETHTLVFMNDELRVIIDALAETPYKISAPIIGTIQSQLQAGFEEKKRKAEAEAKTEKK